MLLMLMGSTAHAETTGKLTGTITSAETGEALAGVNVYLDGTGLGAATDLNGRYTILRIPPGSYTIVVSMIGYNTVRTLDARIRIDQTTTLNLKLEPATIGLDAITVTADRPLVQPDRTFSQANVGADEMALMPVEEFEEVVALQAGVIRGSGGAMHIRGGRSSEIGYLIDGVSVSDPYNAGMAVEIETNAIQELQVISGTFNAEYGQAMSGIINIVTRDGSYDKYSGNFDYRIGDYQAGTGEGLSGLFKYQPDTTLYPHIDRFRPSGIQDASFSLNGPIPLLQGRGSVFLSGRYVYDEGYLFGRRRFVPDSYSWSDSLGKFVLDHYGDNAVMPLSWSRQQSLQGKLNLRLTPRLRFALNLLNSRTGYQSYSHKFKYNPDGNYQNFRNNSSLIAKLEQSLSPTAYLIYRYSNVTNDFSQYVHKDTADYTVDPDVFRVGTGYNFYPGGMLMGQFFRTTRVNTGKLDFVSQVTPLHQLKAGLEYRRSELYRKSYTILLNENTHYKPEIPAADTPNFDEYTRNPKEWAGYLQDKIEYSDLIINLGLRYDYFNPSWKVLTDPSDPNYTNPIKPINQYFDENGDGEIAESEARPDNQKSDGDRLAYWFKDAGSKYQFSPRLAIAFPITDRGVMHISYGHFFQMPPFSYLYANPDFEVTPGFSTIMGNADLEPQRTTEYEIGLQQQLTSTIGIEVTGSYKDIRNLTDTKIVDTFVAGDRYAIYVNRDYGNVRGIEFSFIKRRSGMISGNLSYTYQIAEGNASDPNSAYYDEQNGTEPEKQIVALDWDQRHTINCLVTLHLSNAAGISLIGQYGSGLPYTPSFAGTRIAFENSERKPSQYTFDMKGFYRFRLGRFNGSLHLNVYNLTDRRNERFVYSDTGRASYSLVSTYVPQQQDFNTLNEYLTRPDYYSAPRLVKLGVSIEL